MDAPPPTHPKHTAAHSRLYASQVRAFIEASEVVHADPDTIEDILDGLDEHALNAEDGSDEADAPDSDDGVESDLLAMLDEGACL